ncbi:uncharacterized protein L203_104335 [Cryptococcus depauperatus CBS 7841]|uniref:Uncharacterized protein n=1 Tax=Cryptococcus depauperatus CBS 7841 TaxID=1295531 RepID=A0AAJ8JVJ6_9TREE
MASVVMAREQPRGGETWSPGGSIHSIQQSPHSPVSLKLTPCSNAPSENLLATNYHRPYNSSNSSALPIHPHFSYYQGHHVPPNSFAYQPSPYAPSQEYYPRSQSLAHGYVGHSRYSFPAQPPVSFERHGTPHPWYPPPYAPYSSLPQVHSVPPQAHYEPQQASMRYVQLPTPLPSNPFPPFPSHGSQSHPSFPQVPAHQAQVLSVPQDTWPAWRPHNQTSFISAPAPLSPPISSPQSDSSSIAATIDLIDHNLRAPQILVVPMKGTELWKSRMCWQGWKTDWKPRSGSALPLDLLSTTDSTTSTSSSTPESPTEREKSDGDDDKYYEEKVESTDAPIHPSSDVEHDQWIENAGHSEEEIDEQLKEEIATLGVLDFDTIPNSPRPSLYGTEV